MLINIVIALLAWFLAGQFPWVGAGFPSFLLWVILLFVVTGVGASYVVHDGTPRPWWF